MNDKTTNDLPDSPCAGQITGHAISWSLNGMIYLIFLGDPASVVAFRVNPMYGIREVRLSEDMERIIIDYAGGASAVLSAVPLPGGRRIPLPLIEPVWGALPAKTRNIVEFISNNFSAYWRLDIDPSAKLPPGSSYAEFKLPPRMPAGFDWDGWARGRCGKRYLAAPRRRTESPLELCGGPSCNFEKEDLKRGWQLKLRRLIQL